ncbi:thiamine phosphate synthase [Chitinimonas lacunae]|uniref:Thiamine-phosphate synthase n=1 Tax=Chitinimonas lacunae TaxID=1963018 RepID=A0ABV8MQQ8_9NEIS
MKGNIIDGLYAITPDWLDDEHLLETVEAVLAGGVSLLQYRNKRADAATRLRQARALRALTRRFTVPLIINDHLDLAEAISAEGVHLGGNDGNLAVARARLGPTAIIGASCYASIERARAARAAGASYLAFGAVFPSLTKPNAPLAPLTLFAQAAELGLPTVAIGGIDADNIAEVGAAGADAAAVIGSLFLESPAPGVTAATMLGALRAGQALHRGE